YDRLPLCDRIPSAEGPAPSVFSARTDLFHGAAAAHAHRLCLFLSDDRADPRLHHQRAVADAARQAAGPAVFWCPLSPLCAVVVCHPAAVSGNSLLLERLQGQRALDHADAAKTEVDLCAGRPRLLPASCLLSAAAAGTGLKKQRLQHLSDPLL